MYRCLSLPILVLSFALASPLLSAPTPSSIEWWNDAETIQAIGLTAAQRHEIESLVGQSLQRRAQIDAQLAPLRRTIPNLLSQPDLDDQTVLHTLDTQMHLRGAKRRDIITMRMQVRKVLSATQFQQLLVVHPKVMRQSWVSRTGSAYMRRVSKQKDLTPGTQEQEPGKQ